MKKKKLARGFTRIIDYKQELIRDTSQGLDKKPDPSPYSRPDDSSLIFDRIKERVPLPAQKKVDSFVNIKVIGIGGSGNNAIEEIASHRINGLEMVAINTDLQTLSLSQATQKVQIGKLTTKGLGAGGDPEVGKKAAEEDRSAIAKALEGSDIVFITAGMGGGTGSGAAPVVAEIAKREGALTIGVVTRPFSFEGKKRMVQAEQGIENLKKQVDALITISNDRLLTMISKDTSVRDAFDITDRVLRQSVQAIADLITTPGLINLDLADVKAVIQDAGFALVGIGIGRGNNKAATAAEAAISSPLLEVSIKGSSSILVSVTGGLDMSLYEINEIVDLISKAAGREANVVFGAIISENMQDEIMVTVIATKRDKDIIVPEYQEKLEQEDNRKESIPTYNSDRLTERTILTKKGAEAEKETTLDEYTPEEDDDLGITKKYKDKENLNIPTFLRKKYKRL